MQTINDALERLKSADPGVREAAMHELAQSTDPAAVTALKLVYENDPEPPLRALARESAAQIQRNAHERGWSAAPPPTHTTDSAMAEPLVGADGEQTFQMLWDCRFCGTTKLLGVTDRHCPNCGAAQDPAWRYFPSEADLHFIEHPKFAGTDKICPYCQQPNSADAKFCKDCGGDLSGAKEAERVAGIATGLEGAAGARADPVLKQFQAQHATLAKPQRKLKTWQAILILLAAAIVVGGGVFAFLSNSKVSTALSVADLQWKRTIAVENFAPRSNGSWQSSVPADAYSRSCYRKQSGSHQEYDHTENVCRMESVQVQCGYEYSDNGNGSGSRKPKYCDQQQQVCRDEKIYRTVPDYGTWCDYTVDRWAHETDLVSSGGPNDSPVWPNFTPRQTSGIGAERAGARTEFYSVLFKDKNAKSFSFNPPGYDQWATFKVGQSYSVEINRLGSVFWDTLKPAG